MDLTTARRSLSSLTSTDTELNPPVDSLTASAKKVREGGVEPPRPKAQDPKSSASASFATLAFAPVRILACCDPDFNMTQTPTCQFARI